MIKLELCNHNNEYELKNLIHIFEPYLDTDIEYTLISKLNEDSCNTVILENGVVAKEVCEDISQTISEEIEYRKVVKRKIKVSAYRALVSLTGKDMPWGILMGIRPTKIAHKLMEAGYDKVTISNILSKKYYISREKSNLMVGVAEKEEYILAKNKEHEVSLYIGIPFCPTRCLYCSFTSYPLEQKGNQVKAYLEALKKEISYVASSVKDRNIRSLYIGGGTPTSLNEEELEDLLSAIERCFVISRVEEYTVEAGRPDTITREKLRIMKKYGVGRISINPQTMNQKTLELIGRQHSIEDIIEVFQVAREEGHSNINMDLILGLPGETTEDVAYTMKEIQKLMPESITVHTMAVKRASRLKEEQVNYHMVRSDDIEEMIKITLDGAKHMGMSPYYMYRQKDMLGNFENVGYATEGNECIYNVQIMAEKESIIAMGAGAVTKVVYDNGERIERVPNVKSLEDYIMRIDEMIDRKKNIL